MDIEYGFDKTSQLDSLKLLDLHVLKEGLLPLKDLSKKGYL